MKKITIKSFVLIAIIILVSSPVISSSSVLDNNQTRKMNESPFNYNTNQKITQALENVTESLLRKYFGELQEIGPRRVGTYGCEKAAEYLYEKFDELEIDVKYQNWIVRSSGKGHRLFRGQNVEGILPGIGDTKESIVFNAHYDTIKDVPGANDDGSGVVAVLAAANILSKYEFKRTIKFVEFSGEEVGLLGSREYVEELYENDEDIFIEFNVDSIGYAKTATGGRNASFSYSSNVKWMIDEIKEINEAYGINLYIKNEWKLDPYSDRAGSDYFYFYKYGYDTISLWDDEHNPYHHTPNDTIDHINFSYLTNMTKLMVASIAYMADIDNTYPQVQIGSPRRGIFYYEDRFIRNLKYEKTIVIDDLIICVEVKPGDAPIEKVEFYINGKLKNTDTKIPYQWRLNEISIRKHKMKVIAYDEAGRTASDQLQFFHFNIRTKK